MNNPDLTERVYKRIHTDPLYLPFSDPLNPVSEEYRSHLKKMVDPENTITQMDIFFAELEEIRDRYKQAFEEKKGENQLIISPEPFLSHAEINPNISLQIHKHVLATTLEINGDYYQLETNIEDPSPAIGIIRIQANVHKSIIYPRTITRSSN